MLYLSFTIVELMYMLFTFGWINARPRCRAMVPGAGDLLDAHGVLTASESAASLLLAAGGFDHVVSRAPTSTTLPRKMSTMRRISARFSGLARTLDQDQLPPDRVLGAGQVEHLDDIDQLVELLLESAPQWPAGRPMVTMVMPGDPRIGSGFGHAEAFDVVAPAAEQSPAMRDSTPGWLSTRMVKNVFGSSFMAFRLSFVD